MPHGHSGSSGKKMTELRTWPTQYTDQGWVGKLSGLAWVQQQGQVTEYWNWTAPTDDGNDKNKNQGKSTGSRATRKGKGNGKNAVTRNGKGTVGKGYTGHTGIRKRPAGASTQVIQKKPARATKASP